MVSYSSSMCYDLSCSDHMIQRFMPIGKRPDLSVHHRYNRYKKINFIFLLFHFFSVYKFPSHIKVSILRKCDLDIELSLYR